MSPVDTDIVVTGYVLLLMAGCCLAIAWTVACRMCSGLAAYSIEDREDER